MIMSIIALILFAIVSVNTNRQNSAIRYAQGPRGQMGFKWTRQYAQKPAASGYGYPKYGHPINTQQSYSQDPHGKAASGSTESTQTTIFKSTEEGFDIDNTIQNTFESEISIDQKVNIMDCLQDKCTQSFDACFNDPQCKEWMLQWQQAGTLNPECLPSQNIDESDEEAIGAFATTNTMYNTYDKRSTSSTSNTESTYETYYTYETSTTYDYDTTSSTSSTDNTYNGDSFSYTEISSSDIYDETEESECEYTELFWNSYNCGVENYCYADPLKLAESHQYLVHSPSNFRVTANVTGSRSGSTNWTILLVALCSALGAVVMFEITRRLYKRFQNKIQCEYPCQCLALYNSIRYLKNKWEQIRGYKYEKTHHDLDAIEESTDAEVYGIGSSSDKEETMETKNKDTINNDSDISDDVELQRTDDDVIDIIDDQFIHENQITIEEEEKETESVDNDRKEIIVEAVQEPIQES